MSAIRQGWITKLPYILIVLAWLGLGYLIIWPIFGPQSKQESTDLSAVTANKKNNQIGFAKTLESLLQSQQFLRLTENPEDVVWLSDPVSPAFVSSELSGQELVGRNNPFILPEKNEIFVNSNQTSTLGVTSTPNSIISTTSTTSSTTTKNK